MSKGNRNKHGLADITPQERIQVQATAQQNMIEKATLVHCPKCNNFVFEEKIALGRVSPLESPTGEEVFIAHKLTVCANCKAVLGGPNFKESKKIDGLAVL